MNRRNFMLGLGVTNLTVMPLISFAGNYLQTSAISNAEQLKQLMNNLKISLSSARINLLVNELSNKQHFMVVKVNSLFVQRGKLALEAIKSNSELSSFLIDLAKAIYINKRLDHKHATFNIAPSLARTLNASCFNYKAQCGGATGFWAKAPSLN